MSDINYVVGDATDPIREPGAPAIICHIVNDCGRWGAGFVLAVSRRWPGPAARFRARHEAGGSRLGLAETVEVSPGLWVANLYAQRGIGQRNGPPIRYDALRKCLTMLAATIADAGGGSVHMPRIGCGLAGGRWEEVEPIVRETLCAAGVPVTVYDLPQM